MVLTFVNFIYFLCTCSLLLVGSRSSEQRYDKGIQITDNVQLEETDSIPHFSKYRIFMDIAHKQMFWNDPTDMDGVDSNQIERVKYMTGEIMENAASLDAELVYLKKEIQSGDLSTCDVLFIHIPSSKYSSIEIETIRGYLRGGGSLFLVMDDDYWSTLEQTNVNDIIEPFGIQFGTPNPDTLSGGYTEDNVITNVPLKIPFHGGRIISGGTPFCFGKQSQDRPFGSFMTLEGGGKIVVMGDGMVSLYMTSWQDVNDYQCREFMHDVFQWLLE